MTGDQRTGALVFAGFAACPVAASALEATDFAIFFVVFALSVIASMAWELARG